MLYSPCLYGMGLSKRVHNLPLSNEGKWCGLVNKISPYQHGVLNICLICVPGV